MVGLPSNVVLAKGGGKGCRIDHTEYHRNLSEVEREFISKVIRTETKLHYNTKQE